MLMIMKPDAATFRDNEFEDGNHFYRFLVYKRFISKCYNFRGVVNDSEPNDTVRLSCIILAILESYASNNHLHLDYMNQQHGRVPKSSWVKSDWKKDENMASKWKMGCDDIPNEVADPDARKPEDWDDVEDGEWTAPTIPNPEYKGPWKAKKIKNPNLKGKWKAPMIDNPDGITQADVGLRPNMSFSSSKCAPVIRRLDQNC